MDYGNCLKAAKTTYNKIRPSRITHSGLTCWGGQHGWLLTISHT